MKTFSASHPACNRVGAIRAEAFVEERVTSAEYTYPAGSYNYGNLTYAYDLDGRLIGKDGSLLSELTTNDESETFSLIDGLSTWNGDSVFPDAAGNITYEPVAHANLTYDARNALVSATNSNTNLAEAYDPLERRWTTNDNGYIWSYLHAGDTLMGSNESVFGTWNFLTMPGEGSSLESWYTSGSTVTKYVPLTDADGSVMALVNLANPAQPPATTYSYDPFGMQQVNNGGIWDYPFKYQGAESEPVDWGLYASPGGLYDPYLQQNLGTCPIGLGAPQGLGGSGGGGGGGGQSAGQMANEASKAAAGAAGAAYAAANGAVTITALSDGGYAAFVDPTGVSEAIVGLAILGYELSNLLSGGSPSIPRQLMHRKHAIYGVLGISADLTVTMDSTGGAALGASGIPGATSGFALADVAAMVMDAALYIGDAAVAAVLAPEVAGAALVTVSAVAVGVASYEAYQYFAKGERNWEKGRSDDPMSDLSIDDLDKILKDPNRSPQDKKKARKFRKWKRMKDKQCN